MRKIKILLLTVFIAVGLHQANGQAQLALGIKGGINLASLDGTTSPGTAYDNRTGYHLGAYFQIKFTKIAIQPEILFSQQGQKFTLNTGQSLSSNFDYISVPVMVKLYLVAGLNLQAGVQFGFLSSSSGDVYNTSTGAITNQDMGSFVHSTDFSVPVGIGWDLPLGLNITARYNIGISEVNKAAGDPNAQTIVTSMGTNAVKNQVFQFSIGFRLFKFGN